MGIYQPLFWQRPWWGAGYRKHLRVPSADCPLRMGARRNSTFGKSGNFAGARRVQGSGGAVSRCLESRPRLVPCQRERCGVADQTASPGSWDFSTRRPATAMDWLSLCPYVIAGSSIIRLLINAIPLVKTTVTENIGSSNRVLSHICSKLNDNKTVLIISITKK